MKKLVIIGGNGHGSEITSVLADNVKYYNKKEWNIIGFLNDFEKTIDQYPVIGNISRETIERLIEEDCYFAWGFHLIQRNPLTLKIFQKLEIPRERMPIIVHHSAFLGENIEIHPGVIIMSNAYISPRVKLGLGTMVKPNTCIGHDVKCGPLCHFAMGSITGSFTQIGICSDISIGATTLEFIKIGNCAMAGAKSLITHDIPDGEIHIGAPSRFFKNIKED